MQIKKSTFIILMIVFIAIGAVGGYFAFKGFKSDNKSTKNDQKETAKEDEKPSTLEESVGETEENELLKVINELKMLDYYKKNINESNQLTNNEMLWIVLSNTTEYKNLEPISVDKMQDAINKYFGETINKEDIYMFINRCNTVNEPIYIYDESQETFKYNEEKSYSFACTPFSMEILNRIGAATKDGNTYKVVVYKAYSQNNDFFGESAYYGTITSTDNAIQYNEKDKLFDVEWDPNLDNPQITDINTEFSKITNDKLTKVTYTFEKVNSNYVLKSYIVE